MNFHFLDFILILTFTHPTFTYVNARKKKPLEMYLFKQKRKFNAFLRHVA